MNARRRASHGTRFSAALLLTAAAATAGAEAWRPQPFSEAEMRLRTVIGEVRFGASVTGGKPTRLAKLALSVDGRALEVPAQAYRDVVNPRLQETMALVPQDCVPEACTAPAAVMVRYYPALGNPKLPKTAACASSWLRIVFDRQRVQGASVIECLGSKHERERIVFRATP